MRHERDARRERPCEFCANLTGQSPKSETQQSQFGALGGNWLGRPRAKDARPHAYVAGAGGERRLEVVRHAHRQRHVREHARLRRRVRRGRGGDLLTAALEHFEVLCGAALGGRVLADAHEPAQAEQRARLGHLGAERDDAVRRAARLALLSRGVDLHHDVERPVGPQQRDALLQLARELGRVDRVHAVQAGHRHDLLDLVGLQVPDEMPSDVSGKHRRLLDDLVDIVLAEVALAGATAISVGSQAPAGRGTAATRDLISSKFCWTAAAASASGVSAALRSFSWCPCPCPCPWACSVSAFFSPWSLPQHPPECSWSCSEACPWPCPCPADGEVYPLPADFDDDGRLRYHATPTAATVATPARIARMFGR
eukprot:scaffold14551_cov61-Phaeocystis_antarctica.AAC.9